jgi:hypothetical protein
MGPVIGNVQTFYDGNSNNPVISVGYGRMILLGKTENGYMAQHVNDRGVRDGAIIEISNGELTTPDGVTVNALPSDGSGRRDGISYTNMGEPYVADRAAWTRANFPNAPHDAYMDQDGKYHEASETPQSNNAMQTAQAIGAQNIANSMFVGSQMSQAFSLGQQLGAMNNATTANAQSAAGFWAGLADAMGSPTQLSVEGAYGPGFDMQSNNNSMNFFRSNPSMASFMASPSTSPGFAQNAAGQWSAIGGPHTSAPGNLNAANTSGYGLGALAGGAGVDGGGRWSNSSAMASGLPGGVPGPSSLGGPSRTSSDAGTTPTQQAINSLAIAANNAELGQARYSSMPGVAGYTGTGAGYTGGQTGGYTAPSGGSPGYYGGGYTMNPDGSLSPQNTTFAPAPTSTGPSHGGGPSFGGGGGGGKGGPSW